MNTSNQKLSASKRTAFKFRQRPNAEGFETTTVTTFTTSPAISNSDLYLSDRVEVKPMLYPNQVRAQH
ncbi:hypothetical protein HDC92_004972 [Pedobacter sp. AK017]|uniref:hypothetical protein n=1 Tax=Pedobacter sp. AK017 TaxID=2723073 RepID=UPI001614456E|nr:hypothetical protein [Pedobacter sp. AK017]MBB5441265.1 hypothetical protein [Pedobacter sp. AK017]